MALTIFDIGAGETRDITQADLDELMVIRASHGRVMSFLAEERTRLLTEMANARAKHAPVEKEVENNG